MSNKDTVFFKENKAYFVDFNAEKISSDGGVLLLENNERKSRIIKHIASSIKDSRNQSYVSHDVYKMLKQRTFMVAMGYEDVNDIDKLKDDELFTSMFANQLASQPTISRFENSIDKHQIFSILYAWLDKYVKSLKGRKKVTIDIDSTDAQTYGHQQFSLFNGFYGHLMYNELYFHDGDTGQIIVPVLRPGNAHSNWWYVSILKRIVKSIKTKYPDIQIFIRADSGFSTPKFYEFARANKLKYTLGIASNAVLKEEAETIQNIVKEVFVSVEDKVQVFTKGFDYQAGTWSASEKCYAKVESTGKGLNVRYFISNFEEVSPQEIYFDFYVKRGDRSENRIKEVKNMCFADRMSNKSFWANFMRLIISSLAYELLLLVKQQISKTDNEKAKKWQIENIRLFLLKIGGLIRKTKRRIFISLSKSAVYKDLFMQLVYQ